VLHDPTDPTGGAASPVAHFPTPASGRWCGLNPWAVLGFAVWLLLMGYLRSLERQMPTNWLKLGLPLLAQSYRPLCDWTDSQRQVLSHGLLVDALNLLLYPVVLWSLLMWITRCRRRAGKCCARCFQQAARLALLAMPFDLLENLVLYWMVNSGTEASAVSLRLLTVVSLFKLACAFVPFCWFLVGWPVALWECLSPTQPPASPTAAPSGGQVRSPGNPLEDEGFPT
jgi:hypothetical protein